MVYDNLKNCAKYYALHPNFKKAFDFITDALAEKKPLGKYEIDGKDVYAMIMEYETKNIDDCKFEAHRKYIDIQYLIKGTEVMQITDTANLETTVEYDFEKDIEFYGNYDKAGQIAVDSNEFVVFFPHDAHRPSISFNGSEMIKKIVVKVAVKE